MNDIIDPSSLQLMPMHNNQCEVTVKPFLFFNVKTEFKVRKIDCTLAFRSKIDFSISYEKK